MRSTCATRAWRSAGRPANGAGSVTSAIGEVARWLGNTPAVCRSSYIHPRILEAYAEGGSARRRRRANVDEILRSPVRHGLGADEREVLALLRRVQEGKSSMKARDRAIPAYERLTTERLTIGL